MRYCVLAMLLTAAVSAQAGDWLVKKPSARSVDQTVDRLEEIVLEKGFTVFARVDHAAGARKVGKELRPMELLIFGNPKVGTALMSSQATAGIDLPVRVLVWEDAGGQVWLAYTDPAHLAARHGITDREDIVAKMTKALGAFSDAAAGR